MHDKKPDPTPEEIRLACLEIQAGWSEAEERKRRANKVPDIEPREVRVESGSFSISSGGGI
jgi:hypothetical protein